MRRHRNAKIIATLGPASASPDGIKALFEAGVDCFRINMSHGDEDSLTKLHGMIRAAENAVGRPIGILVDLQGPKIRIGEIPGDGIDLTPGQKLTIREVAQDAGDIPLPHPEILTALKVDDQLLLDDGRVRLIVTDKADDHVIASVLSGTKLTSRKGVNVPDSLLTIDALTEEDRQHLHFACDLGIDWIALSFVQRAMDVVETKALVDGRAGVMAKIEKPSAVTDIDAIAAEADGIMVARGDLGVEAPIEQVPGMQRAIIAAACKQGKPVVVATQMLESMIKAPMPTRAEVSDIATAVRDGADAVMLSGETAVGDYPIETVETMSRTIMAAEKDGDGHGDMMTGDGLPDAADAIAAAAREVAETIRTAAIVCYTTSGSTAMRVARERPDVPIVTLTPLPDVARRLALIWGLHCVVTDDATSFTDMVERAAAFASADGFARKGDMIVVTAGVPFGTPGTTNALRIATVG